MRDIDLRSRKVRGRPVPSLYREGAGVPSLHVETASFGRIAGPGLWELHRLYSLLAAGGK